MQVGRGVFEVYNDARFRPNRKNWFIFLKKNVSAEFFLLKLLKLIEIGMPLKQNQRFYF